MRELQTREVVTVALFMLGGASRPIDTEDIAIKAAELSPGAFSWKKYRENIDIELVRKSLSHAKSDIGYVVGSHKEGWILTPSGLEFATNCKNNAWKKAAERAPGREQQQVNREKERLLASEAYAVYEKDGLEGVRGLSINSVDSFFRINDYVRGEARIQKIARIENHFSKDPQLGDLVKLLAVIEKERFADES